MPRTRANTTWKCICRFCKSRWANSNWCRWLLGDATANLFPDMSPRKKVTSGRAGGQCERTALLERLLWLMQAVEPVRRIHGGIGHVVFQRGDDGFVRDVGPVGLEQ